MKLAEALLLRADLQSKISELEMRLSNNAVVQEGEQPAEDPKALIKQLDGVLNELERMITAINITNASVRSGDVTLTELLARRDCMKRRLSAMRNFLDDAASTGRRARSSEIKLLSSVPVAEIQKDVDRQAGELRRLDVDIQALNWTTDLIE